MRGAFYGQYATTIMLEGALVAVGLAAVCLSLGSRVFVRERLRRYRTTTATGQGRGPRRR